MAPDFTARSTHGLVNLSDYRGRWLVFFTHPADFTPVCTSEFLALAAASERFTALDCQLLGHSVDSLFAHLAWMRAIRDDFGVAIPFPIVEDPTLVIARAFGMAGSTDRHSATVRDVYVLSPDGVLAASLSYPLEVGRSVDELLRLVAALQCAQGGAVVTPADWRPGEPVLLPPAVTAEAVLGASRSTGWFYRLNGQIGGGEG
jgi:peroxiredoxin (alkyl hydroperoxide reductase subunit C)